MKKGPCYECPSRRPDCHNKGQCKAWEEYREKWEKISAQMKMHPATAYTQERAKHMISVYDRQTKGRKKY